MIFGNNQDSIEKIEQQLFVNFNLLPSFSRRYVHICNKSLRIWTVSLNTESKNTPVVLIHGFGGGSALWLQNFKHLSKSRPLYAIDLLGFARSSRSSFSSDPIVSEMQFIESIENWRKELDIKEMVLLGHSFGGYLICSYSIKYPDRTKALILVDPWGFLEQVPSINRLDTPTPIWVNLFFLSLNINYFFSSIFRLNY
jgi:pimeloyl-ACP methyl ester carboxylesterase